MHDYKTQPSVRLVQQPIIIRAAGNKHKEIAEYVGRLNSATEALSIAHMKSPAGWSEPGQTPEFDEYTVVVRGCFEWKLARKRLT